LLKFWYHSAAAVDAEIGLYSRAYQVVLTLIFIPLSVCNAIFPSLAKAHSERDEQRSRSLFSYSYALLLLGGAPIATSFFLMRREFMGTIFGPAFLPGASMLAIVIWTLPLVFLTMPLSNVFAARDRQAYATFVSFATAVFNIGLNAFVIPRFGGKGAAFSTAASELFGLVLLLFLMLRMYRDLFSFRMLLPILLFQVVAITSGLAFGHLSFSVRILFAAGYCAVAAAYAAFLFRRRQKTEWVS
jgi:O-antigen/teichoic acid export membrane protein